MIIRRCVTRMTVLVAAALGAGCSWFPFGPDLPESLARQVIQSDYCGLTEQGITYIDSADQLTRFASLPSQNLAIEQLRALSLDREHVLIVGLGQKMTGGFGVTLANAKIIDDTLSVTVILRRPPADAMVTQALTTPCAVLAITPDHWKTLEVSGNGLGPLRLIPRDRR